MWVAVGWGGFVGASRRVIHPLTVPYTSPPYLLIRPHLTVNLISTPSITLPHLLIHTSFLNRPHLFLTHPTASTHPYLIPYRISSSSLNLPHLLILLILHSTPSLHPLLTLPHLLIRTSFSTSSTSLYPISSPLYSFYLIYLTLPHSLPHSTSLHLTPSS